MKTLIILFISVILLITFSQTEYGKYLQSRERVYLSMHLPVSKQTDLKSAQITHMDGTPVKVTLSAFNYNPLCTTGGYTDIVKQEIYLGYTNPDNATPTVKSETILHELFHESDGHHNLQKYCKRMLDNECAENKAYDFTYLYEQVLTLEKQGWLVISK